MDIESPLKRIVILAVLLTLVGAMESKPQEPSSCLVKHDVGNVVLNRGLAPFFGGGNGIPPIDCLTGSEMPVGACLYPKGSFVTYLGAPNAWIGGVVGGDTLVSGYVLLPVYHLSLANIVYEFLPHEYPNGYIEHRSTLDQSSSKSIGAISEQDFISVSTDTVTEGVAYFPDYFRNRPHVPMGLEIINRSYAWSLSYAEDFVMFDWVIRNIGEKTISGAFFGIYMDITVGYIDPLIYGRPDNLAGFISVVPSSEGCGFNDSLIMMWSADNDGDPFKGEFVNQPVYDGTIGAFTASCPHVSAIQLIDAPVDLIPGDHVSYNWWARSVPIFISFGPRHRENYRDFRTGGIGRPLGDVNQYYTMRNGEIDYDPAYTASISPYDQKWMYPQQDVARAIADGDGIWQILSVGPFDLAPGDELPIVFALVMGENFHTDPNNLANIYRGDPDAYYANLDFSDLVRNANWAKWIYDNPGIDTDNDGYAGEFRVCVLDSILDIDSNWIPTFAETTWYKGDGVPDWRAALPPPAPKMWVTPIYKGIHIRFNGQFSETTPDIFTHLIDFEGYRVYISRDDRETSYSLIASYDIENYDKYIWNEQKQPFPDWDLLDYPMTLKEIRCAYGENCDDSTFDPLMYRPSFPFVHPQFPESLFYWVRHDWNVSELGVTTPIRKRFPNARDPRSLPADSVTSDFYTDDGYLKFFEYEFTIEDILPTVPYYVSVTTFDFGWPRSKLEPLESSISENARQVYAEVVDSLYSGDKSQVVVYPNPYRIDESYRQRGFEGLGQEDRIGQRVRRIHFANIPPKCRIMIYSLDGDLVREIHHDKDPTDPTAHHAEWGLISRNGLAVVSGLYYWVVESDSGTQMGKLAIIL